MTQQLHPGDIFADRLRVVQLLGEGGMAYVYLVEHIRVGRKYALKILKWQMCQNLGLRQRLKTEGLIMGQAQHRNIVAVHDQDETKDGQLFITMDFVSGGSLRDRQGRDGSISSRESTRIVLEVLHGLQCAHGKGIVHRDVKPDNILLDADGIPKLCDFGIAYDGDKDDENDQDDESHRFTKTGTTIGTFWFMAPEQYKKKKGVSVDARADLYATGVMLHALIANITDPTEPFFYVTLAEQPEIMDSIPASLRPVIRKATAKLPEDRYQNAEEMIQALQAAWNDLPTADEEREARRVPLQTMVPETEGQVIVGTRFSLGSSAASGGGAAVSSEVSAGRSVAVPAAKPQARKELPQGGTMVSAGEDSPRLSRRAIAAFAAVASVILFVVYGFWLRTSPSVQPMRPHPEAVTFTEESPVGGGVEESEVDVGAGSPGPEGTEGTKVTNGTEDKVEVPLKPEVKSPPKKVVKSEPKAKVDVPVVVEAPKTRVTLSGDATQVRLVGDPGSFTIPASVPSGTYRVVATFEGEPEAVTVIKWLEVDDKPVAIVCDSSFARCNRQ